MVRIILLLTLFLSLAVLPAKAQSWTTQDSTKTAGEQRLERYELVIGSALAFSLVDYIGYNIFVTSNPAKTQQNFLLHIFDAAFGGTINYFLYKTCGLSSAISFDLLWWTWGLDLGFSGWGDVINPAYPWINRTETSLNTSKWGNSVNWAGWTPIGLVRPTHSSIALNTLYAQAIIGFSVSMAILW
jgi:hypothetical protein